MTLFSVASVAPGTLRAIFNFDWRSHVRAHCLIALRLMMSPLSSAFVQPRVSALYSRSRIRFSPYAQCFVPGGCLIGAMESRLMRFVQSYETITQLGQECLDGPSGEDQNRWWKALSAFAKRAARPKS